MNDKINELIENLQALTVLEFTNFSQAVGMSKEESSNLLYGLVSYRVSHEWKVRPIPTFPDDRRKKILTIKTIREICALGLKEAKEFVDGDTKYDLTDSEAKALSDNIKPFGFELVTA